MACPFRGAALDESFRGAPAPVPPSRRLSRAALFAYGTGTVVLASAAVVIDCATSAVRLYGGPYVPEDASEPVQDSGLATADVQVGSAEAGDGSAVDAGTDASDGTSTGDTD